MSCLEAMAPRGSAMLRFAGLACLPIRWALDLE